MRKNASTQNYIVNETFWPFPLRLSAGLLRGSSYFAQMAGSFYSFSILPSFSISLLSLSDIPSSADIIGLFCEYRKGMALLFWWSSQAGNLMFKLRRWFRSAEGNILLCCTQITRAKAAHSIQIFRVVMKSGHIQILIFQLIWITVLRHIRTESSVQTDVKRQVRVEWKWLVNVRLHSPV